VIKTTLEELSSALGDRFIFHPGNFSVFGYWDVAYLRRAIENVASNAVKYGDSEDYVFVSYTSKDGEVAISIHNSGKPIAMGERETIFDPFQRVGKARKTGKSGWGIGLSLVKGVVEAHGGRVTFESEEETGTTFILTVPIDCRNFIKKAA
jgi:signal transduction histidine kinase